MFKNTHREIKMQNSGKNRNHRFESVCHENICTMFYIGRLFWGYRPFETVFQSISGRLSERGKKKREVIDASPS